VGAGVEASRAAAPPQPGGAPGAEKSRWIARNPSRNQGRNQGRKWSRAIKKEFRKQLRDTMAAIPRPELHDRSVAACRLLAEQVEFARAEILMIFLSTPHEVDTTQLAIQAWTQMRRVLAPKVSWEQRRMIPIEIRSLDSDVRDSVLGMREPLEGMPIPIGDIDLV